MVDKYMNTPYAPYLGNLLRNKHLPTFHKSGNKSENNRLTIKLYDTKFLIVSSIRTALDRGRQ